MMNMDYEKALVSGKSHNYAIIYKRVLYLK